MAVFEPRRPTAHLGIYGTDEVADVTGAGDTVIAVLTAALAAGAEPPEALRLSQVAAGIVVGKWGNAQATAEEIREVLRDAAGE